jgi:phage major head subunit gpT-like protein
MSVTASARVPSYSMPGMLMKENFADLLNVQFKFVKERDFKAAIQGLKFFTVESTTKDYEKHSYVTGVGLMPKNRDADTLPLVSPIQGFNNTYTPEDYRMAIRIEKRLRETDQYGVIGKQMTSLTQAAKDTVEYYAADTFNTGFGTGASWLCADQMYLFDSARPMEDKSAGTWSNLETASALTQASLATMRVNFRKFVNERGLKRPLIMKSLVVPTALEDTARVILGSTQKPGVFLNDVNPYKSDYGIGLEVWDYLTSDTAWFGMTDKQGGHELYWYWRVKPETYSNVLADNPDVWQARIRMSFVTGCDRPSTLRGNEGA